MTLGFDLNSRKAKANLDQRALTPSCPKSPSGFTHLCRLDSATSTFWTDPFPIKGMYRFLLPPCFIEISVFNTHSVDPDQTPRSVASDLGLHCLLVSQPKRVNKKYQCTCRCWSCICREQSDYPFKQSNILKMSVINLVEASNKNKSTQKKRCFIDFQRCKRWKQKSKVD